MPACFALPCVKEDLDDCCKFYGKQVVNNESPRCEEHGRSGLVAVARGGGI